MRWEAWILVVLFAINVLGQPIMVGRKREPATPGQAAFFVVFNLVLVYLAMRLGGVSFSQAPR